MSMPKGEAIAGSRWRQLQSCNVAVFDLGARVDADRAGIAYELGIARVLGKPIVVLAKQDQDVPFDVDVRFVRYSSEWTDSVAEVADAIDQALVWTMPRGRSKAVSAAIWDTLERHPIPSGNTYVEQTLNQLRTQESNPDPVAVDAALATLASFLGDGRLMLIHPAWLPVYVDGRGSRLFHVMPFRPEWADAAA